MRSQRRYLVVAAALVAVGACGLPSADEFASGSSTSGREARDGGRASDAQPDPIADGGGSVLTSSPEAATDAPPDAPPPPITNLLPPNNADFETPCSSGNGSYLASLAQSDVERSGMYSCEVCRAQDHPNADIWSIDNGLSVTPAPGQEYHATAWVRRPPGSTDALKVALVLRTHTESYDPIDSQESAPVILNDEWQPLSVTITLTKPAPLMDTYLWASNQNGLTTPCFLVDDYVVWRTK